MLPKARSKHIIFFFYLVIFSAIPVAALSTHCKLTSFGRWCLSTIIWWLWAGLQVFFFNSRFSAGVGPTVGQVAWRCISTREWKCLGLKHHHTAHTHTWVAPPTPLKHSRVRQFTSTSSLPINFVVAMMNAIMRMHSIQQVSYCTGKRVNTSYFALGRESMLSLGLCPHDNIARTLVQHNWC